MPKHKQRICDHPPIPPVLQLDGVAITRKATRLYREELRKIKRLRRKMWASQELAAPFESVSQAIEDRLHNESIYERFRRYDSESDLKLHNLVRKYFTEPPLNGASTPFRSVYDTMLADIGLTREQADKMSAKEIDEYLHVEKAVYEPFEDHERSVKSRVEKYSREGADNRRKTVWTWRIAEEAEQRRKMGWYPFFVTLTLDPKRVLHTMEFWKEGKQLYLYIRKIAGIVAKVMGHKGPKSKYFAGIENYVVWQGHLEHGKSREHHHMHVMLWLRDVPSHWKIDPNAGITDKRKRNRTRCLELESLWKWQMQGIGHAKYWRSTDDVWKKHGFCTPVEMDKEGNAVPMKIRGIRAAGAYMVKYMTKDEREWNHRVRGTRKLGTARIEKFVKGADDWIIDQLAERPPQFDTSFAAQLKTSIPLFWVRQLVKDEQWHRQAKTGRKTLESHMADNNEIHANLIGKVYEGVRIERLTSEEKYELITECMPPPSAIYDAERYLAAVDELAKVIPADVRSVQRTSLGGMKT